MEFPDLFLGLLRDGLREAEVDAVRPLVIAVSGGPDSTALLLGLEALQSEGAPPLIVAHFNHRLRGRASDGDARFVADLCASRGVECVSGTGDTPSYTRESGLSPEAAARRLRYNFLAHVAHDREAQGVATGHTMDDQAETVLLNAVRGSGLRGVRGMRPRSQREPPEDGVPPLQLLRPMLRIRRVQTTRFCHECEVRPRADASNEDVQTPRNRLRQRVLPQLEVINPEAVRSLARLAELAALDIDVVDNQVTRLWAAISTETGDGALALDRTPLAELDPALTRQLLRAAFVAAAGVPDGITRVHIEQMAELALGRAGTRLDLPGGVRMEVERSRVLFSPHASTAAADCPFPDTIALVALATPGKTPIGDGCAIEAAVSPAPVDPSADAPWVAYLDAASISGELLARARVDGDRFQPLGMAGVRKLQDFMVDEGVPRAWRSRIPVVECERGIAWVVGYRPAEWAKITAGTQRALRLEFTNPSAKLPARLPDTD